MNHLIQNRQIKLKIAVAVSAVFLLSLIPLCVIGRYDHPSADDFSYGLLTAQTWTNTHSFIKTIYGACKQVSITYFSWQGTFSAVFLMSLQPAVFGENYYMYTPVVLLFFFIFGTALLFKVLLINYMKADKLSFTVISCFTLIMSIQFMYSPVEGFYWYNGGIYYTFFYSLSLILISLILLLFKSKSYIASVCYIIISSVLAFVIGGGNYTTSFTTVLILAILLAYFTVKKNKKAFAVGIAFLFLLAGFTISILAPGNAIRQASVGHPSALKAIFLSFVYGAYSICNSTTVPVVAGWIFLIPFIYAICRKSAFSFKHPFLFAILTFCVYCAQVCPPFYALGLSLPERLIDIVYYSYYILVLLDLFYFLGWLSKKVTELKDKHEWEMIFDCFLKRADKYWAHFTVAMAILFVCGTIGVCTVSKGDDGKPQFSRIPTSISAAQSLLNGDAKIYDAEVKQRILAYRDTLENSVSVKDYSVKPYVLYYNDIVEDKTDWRNQTVAKFYGKHSVQLLSRTG